MRNKKWLALFVVFVVSVLGISFYADSLPKDVSGRAYIIESMPQLCGALIDQDFTSIAYIIDGQLWICVPNTFIPDAVCYDSNGNEASCDCICYRKMDY